MKYWWPMKMKCSVELVSFVEQIARLYTLAELPDAVADGEEVLSRLIPQARELTGVAPNDLAGGAS